MSETMTAHDRRQSDRRKADHLTLHARRDDERYVANIIRAILIAAIVIGAVLIVVGLR